MTFIIQNEEKKLTYAIIAGVVVLFILAYNIPVEYSDALICLLWISIVLSLIYSIFPVKVTVDIYAGTVEIRHIIGKKVLELEKITNVEFGFYTVEGSRGRRRYQPRERSRIIVWYEDQERILKFELNDSADRHFFSKYSDGNLVDLYKLLREYTES